MQLDEGTQVHDFATESSEHTSKRPGKRPGKRAGKSDERRPVYVNGRLDPRLYYRGRSKVIQYQGPDPDGSGESVRKSTRCKDPLAAKYKADEFERLAANPRLRAAEGVTLEEGIRLYAENQKRKGVKVTTIEKVVTQKLGWFVHSWGATFPLNNLTPQHVLKHIDDRKKMPAGRKDGKKVCDYTIKREVQYLQYMLEHLSFLGKFTTPIAQVIPIANNSVDLPGTAQKRKRHPSLEAAWQIVMAMPENRRAHVAALAAGMMRLGESFRLRREDVNLTDKPRTLKTAGTNPETGEPWVVSPRAVFIRGSKTEGSYGEIAITPITEPIWHFVMANAPGGEKDSDLLFLPYANPSKQIARVCKRLGLPHLSCHDFRRAGAKWHRKQGMTPTGCSKLLRHTNDRLAQEIYADLDTAEEIAAVYLPELRPELAKPNPFAATESGVLPVCAAEGFGEVPKGSNVPTEAEISRGKDGNQGNGAALVTAVHGRATEDAYNAVTATVSAIAPDGGVRPMCGPKESPDSSHGEASPVGPSAGTLTALAAAISALAQARQIATSAEAQAALDAAMAKLALGLV